MPIVDKDGHVVALLAGCPSDENWNRDAAALLEKIRAECPEFDDGCHRRGDFPTLRCGVSHGGGRMRPMNFVNSQKKQRALNELNSHPSFIRIAGFMNCKHHVIGAACIANIYQVVLATWAPKLHEHYAKYITSLFAHNKTLHRPFSKSIFPATAYNLGPQTCCKRHFNFANLAYGWCGIAVLGRFDPTKGGHLVLWELGLVVEFPPGSVALIPGPRIKRVTLGNFPPVLVRCRAGTIMHLQGLVEVLAFLRTRQSNLTVWLFYGNLAVPLIVTKMLLISFRRKRE